MDSADTISTKRQAERRETLKCEREREVEREKGEGEKERGEDTTTDDPQEMEKEPKKKETGDVTEQHGKFFTALESNSNIF